MPWNYSDIVSHSRPPCPACKSDVYLDVSRAAEKRYSCLSCMISFTAIYRTGDNSDTVAVLYNNARVDIPLRS